MKINLNKLQQQFPSANIEYFDQIGSTNDLAKKRIEKNPNTWGMIVANQQTTGRGTNQRSFYSPTTGIYFSIYQPLAIDQPFYPGCITANIGLIVLKAIESIWHKQLGLKWVNDLYLNQHKVGGILCEAQSNIANQLQGVVMGIGLNLTTQKFPTNMFREGGAITTEVTEKQVEQLLSIILQEVKKRRQTIQSDVVGDEYQSHMILMGQQVEIEQGSKIICGEVLGVTPFNELILQTTDDILHINAGRILRWQA